MSEQPVTTSALPKWDLADRMRKSLREQHDADGNVIRAEISVQEIAADLDVSPRTVSNWLNGRLVKGPSTATGMQWALRTGVPFTWFLLRQPRTLRYRPCSRRSAQVKLNAEIANSGIGVICMTSRLSSDRKGNAE